MVISLRLTVYIERIKIFIFNYINCSFCPKFYLSIKRVKVNLAGLVFTLFLLLRNYKIH